MADPKVVSSASSAPTDTPPEQENETAKTVGFWSTVGAFIAFILAGFKSESGRETAGKAIKSGTLLGKVGWEHLTHRRGKVSQLVDTAYPHVDRWANGQQRALRREERRRKKHRGILGWVKKAINPAPSWTWRD